MSVGEPPDDPAGRAGPRADDDASGEHRDAPEYRIDALARLAGTTVRNVRAYQDRGLLPGPRRLGRVGLYSDSHLARLRLVGALLARGYTLANIAELIAGWEQGRDLSELLGLERALIGSWGEEPPSTIGRVDIIEILGETAAAELLAAGARDHLLEIDGDRVRIENPRMLEGAAVLMGAGVPVRAVLELGAYLVQAVDEIAARYVELIDRHVFSPLPEPLPDTEIPRLTAIIRQLRPLAKQVVDAELNLALERRIEREIGERLSRLVADDEQVASG